MYWYSLREKVCFSISYISFTIAIRSPFHGGSLSCHFMAIAFWLTYEGIFPLAFISYYLNI